MKPYVTYSILFGGLDPTDPYFSTESDSATELQGMTGAWQSYGLHTPIYLVDILDTFGVVSMLLVSNEAVDWGENVVQNIGVDAVKSFSFPWKEKIGTGTDRIDLLMFYNEKLLEASVPEALRLDYCGDPMDAQGVVSDTAALEMAAALKDTTDAIPSNPTSVRYYHWMSLGGAGAVTQALIDFWASQSATQAPRGGVLWDRAQKDSDCASDSLLGAPGWPGIMNVTDTLASPTLHYYFLTAYDTWLASNAVLSHSALWVPYYRNFAYPTDYAVDAAKNIARAAYYATLQVTSSGNSLLTIMSLIRNALVSYYMEKRISLEADRAFWNNMRQWTLESAVYPIVAPDPAGAYQTALNALNAEKRALEISLLTDKTFIESVCSNDVDSSVEALALFKAVRLRWKALIAERTEAEYNRLNDLQYSLEYDEATLADFIRPYLL